MCIIIVKPAGTRLPKLRVFQNCAENNADGIGYMTIHDGKVYGSKGYTDEKELHEHLSRMPKQFPLVIHFRFATHGAIDATATHPFPVSAKVEELKKLKWVSDTGIAHNGVISGFGTHKKDGLSDTQEYIQKVIADPMIRSGLFHPKVQRMLELTTSSKFAYMNGKGDIAMIGHFYQSGGCFYSNLDYKYGGWQAKYYGYNEMEWEWEREYQRQITDDTAINAEVKELNFDE
jgi:hypothetical protein